MIRVDFAQLMWLRLRYSLDLLVERRLWWFVALDAYFVLISVLIALGSGGTAIQVYRGCVVAPNLLIALPILANVIALERRAGALDLALAAPSIEAYLLRRMLPISSFFFVQGSLLLLLVPLPPWGRIAATVQSGLLCLLIAAIPLFWAVRLRTAGAVLVASLVTCLLLGPWIFTSPVPPRFAPIEHFRGIPVPLLSWSWNQLVLVSVTLLLYSYARQRLRQPESML